MESKELRALQAPLKEKYKTDPEEARWNLHAEAEVGQDISCKVETEAGTVQAGLHPATGGNGSNACSGDMLLQALVACAGVTLKSVATAMEINIKKGTVKANGLLDFRGTLGVDRHTPVGFKKIELTFELDTNADREKLEKLVELTERYCVVYQTLRNSLETSSSLEIGNEY